MNYEELEEKLLSPIAYAHSTDESILKHFKQKYDIVPYENDIMFIFHHEREFQNKNHIISIHQKCSGRVPMHIFHYIVLTYAYSGTLTITVENQKITLNQGDIIILDKHVPHSVAPTSEHDLGINIILHENYFSHRFINKLPKEQLITQFMIELMNHQYTHNHYLLFYTHQDYLIHNCIQNILCEYFDPMTSSDELIDNFIMILITHLARKADYNTNLSIEAYKNKQLLNDILKYIQQHYQEGNLQQMCQQLGYHPSYISKLVKHFYGKTFKQIINEERMKKATILLQNKDIPIYQIAEDIGIHNLTAFYKRFNQYAGMTPQEYRDSIK